MSNARTSYRENDVRGASPVRLVVMLYDQMIQDLTKAAEAMDQNDVERRTKLINHAILVVGHLQSPLDFENGGKVAQDLDSFYNTLRQSLVWVQFQSSKPGLTQLITDLLAVREAWIAVDAAEKSKGTVAGVPAEASEFPAEAAEAASDRAPMDWQG